MPRVFRRRSFVGRAAANERVVLNLEIGDVQTGEWWVYVDQTLAHHDTSTRARVDLGPAESLYARVVQVEVRCDDTNENTDALSCVIAMDATTPTLDWRPTNENEESAHGIMTATADLFILPVLQ